MPRTTRNKRSRKGKRPAATPRLSDLEYAFMTRWRQLAPDLPEPVREYKFLKKRRFRFDYAFPLVRVAVELEGGTFSGGRHVRGKGYASDCEKYNLATLAGWKVLRFTSDMFHGDPATCIAQVRALLHA